MAQPSSKIETTVELAQSKRMERIRRLSRVMATGCLATAVLLAAAMLFYWAATPSRALFAQAGVPGAGSSEVGFEVRMLGFGISMVPLAALIYGLFNAQRCFSAFAAGQIFAVETIGRLRAFAIAVAASALLKPFAGAALSVLLSWNEGGRKTLAMNVGSDTLIALIFAGTVAVIAWVMTEAIVIADENRQFV